MKNTHPAYVFADNEASGATHHAELTDVLADMLDQFTFGRLDRRVFGSGDFGDGWRCLEVGAGNGSVANELARIVGPSGEVVATDAKPEQVRILPGVAEAAPVQVIGHDIAADPLEPLGRFDLIHARLVLGHLANRREVLANLAGLLNPGGVLVIDEFAGIGWDWCVTNTPDPEAYRLFGQYELAFTTVLRQAGVLVGWGRQVYGAMRDIGLVDVDAEYWSRHWHGGEPGCMLPFYASAQLKPELLAAGMAEADLNQFRGLLLDRRLVIAGNLAVSTIGRKP